MPKLDIPLTKPNDGNPFRVNPEQILQDRMKHARKITRDEIVQSFKAEDARVKAPNPAS
jgi:hypothetical protein